jgi:hypothetical protein
LKAAGAPFYLERKICLKKKNSPKKTRKQRCKQIQGESKINEDGLQA